MRGDLHDRVLAAVRKGLAGPLDISNPLDTSKTKDPVLQGCAVDSAVKNGVTDASSCNTTFPNKNKDVTPLHRFATNFATNKEGLRENTLCSVCGAGGDLWYLCDALIHQECAKFRPRPEPSEPSAAYLGVTAEPDGNGCRVEIVELPQAQRYRRTFAHLQLKPPALVDVAHWRQCIEDGSKFLAVWGEQAQALNWSSADLFGLHAPPEQPHPSYRRLSRYDCTGLIWLLEGRPMVALTEATAAIENPATGSITTYRRFNKPALGPVGDSVLDIDPRWGGI